MYRNLHKDGGLVLQRTEFSGLSFHLMKSNPFTIKKTANKRPPHRILLQIPLKKANYLPRDYYKMFLIPLRSGGVKQNKCRS